MAPKPVVDRRRDIALVLFLLSVGGAWFGFEEGARLPSVGAWLAVSWTVLSLVLGVGIWRASEWARWLTGSVAILQAGRLGMGLVVALFTEPPADRTSWWIVLLVSLVFVGFWIAMAIYLLRPNTRKLFAHVRGLRERPA